MDYIVRLLNELDEVQSDLNLLRDLRKDAFFLQNRDRIKSDEAIAAILKGKAKTLSYIADRIEQESTDYTNNGGKLS